VMLGEVGGQISNLFSDFDVRSYGHRKLSDLVRKTGAFDVEQKGGRTRIRAKPADGSTKV
jgi:OST-HTH/LOTUS domain